MSKVRTAVGEGRAVGAEETRRATLARAVISAWRKSEPTGLLLRELYKECGIKPEIIEQLIKESKYNAR